MCSRKFDLPVQFITLNAFVRLWTRLYAIARLSRKGLCQRVDVEYIEYYFK